MARLIASYQYKKLFSAPGTVLNTFLKLYIHRKPENYFIHFTEKESQAQNE